MNPGVGIPRADYVKAKLDAAQRPLDKAIRDNNQEAKNKAMELLERLRQEFFGQARSNTAKTMAKFSY